MQEIHLVADALYILRQEHQEGLKIVSDSAEAQEEGDHQYEVERCRQIKIDEYEEYERTQE